MCSTEVRLSVRFKTAAHVCVSEECCLSKSTMSAQSVRHLAALLMDSLLTRLYSRKTMVCGNVLKQREGVQFLWSRRRGAELSGINQSLFQCLTSSFCHTDKRTKRAISAVITQSYTKQSLNSSVAPFILLLNTANS